MTVHVNKPNPERNKIDYYIRYALILFLEDIKWLLDHNMGILNALSGIGRNKETVEYEYDDLEETQEDMDIDEYLHKYFKEHDMEKE